jgi:tripartite-type tricarboxylate transporter receptor subunit TctC
VPGYAADFALVMYTPCGTPQPIVEQFHQAFVDALKSPDV